MGYLEHFCSLLDKVLWGGSLDFLQIPTVFYFDLKKHIYLTIAEIIFVIIGVFHSKEISSERISLSFCYRRLKDKFRFGTFLIEPFYEARGFYFHLKLLRQFQLIQIETVINFCVNYQ